jgi:tRNA-dihydrouridine synthase
MVKRKLLRARIMLKQTIQKILEINRIRKHLSFFTDRQERAQTLHEELKLLNRIAEQQAVIVRRYEETLSGKH